MKITLISDTHTKHKQLDTELGKIKGDLLIHAGDFMNSGYIPPEAMMFFKWFNEIDNYDAKIFIAGNHDRWMQDEPEEAKAILAGYQTIDYLEDARLDLWDKEDQQTVIYGSPWQPEFCSWAFNLPRNGDEMKARWDAIPNDTDILITHGPPFGYLDIPGGQSIRVGCEMLRHRVDEIKPKIHVFGHIHGSRSIYHNGNTLFINASVLNEQYQYTNKPIHIEFDFETLEYEIIQI